MSYDHSNLAETLDAARSRLLAARDDSGHWTGHLSSSALSTATAACALEFFHWATPRATIMPAEDFLRIVERALRWIVRNQNADGGWGDTIDSPSNVSTTALCWAAFHACASNTDACRESEKHATRWLTNRAGGTTPQQIAAAMSNAYGDDRSFSTPILAMCAISGRFGKGRDAWREIPALPFELAALPRSWFRYLGLPVVSYALPALIAIGRAIHHHRPTLNPLAWLLRALAGPRTLRVLNAIQPESGGFLEAAPLTSFVVMSLVAIGRAHHPVAAKGAEFLISTVREDGSWPIDTNLATWLTTLSVNALTPSSDAPSGLAPEECDRLRAWISAEQCKHVHHYTRAAPGGWAWTDLSGGVPDADDTPGALLALRALAPRDSEQTASDEDVAQSAAMGVAWLLDIQNRDGGIPTFCRGWGKLAFDRSSPDLTAHALRAWHAWRANLPQTLRRRTDAATDRAVRYLCDVQHASGAWTPLWFGNQHAPSQRNPTYGTTRVLRADGDLVLPDGARNRWKQARSAALKWLLAAQDANGGWGGDQGVTPSIEETALAIEALCDVVAAGELDNESPNDTRHAIERGAAWLIEHTAGGTRFEPAPIGLYFARLWYFEELYPLIFTVSALERVRLLLAEDGRVPAVAARREQSRCSPPAAGKVMPR